MKVSFSNNPQPATGDIPVEATAAPVTPVTEIPSVPTIQPATEIPTAPVTNVALVPAAAALPVAAPSDSPIEFDDNDIKFEDVYLPRVNIVQKVGDLSLVYEPGEIVLNQTLVIHTPANPAKKVDGNPPLRFTVIGFKRRQYAEKVVGGQSGLLVNSEQEVVQAGGTLSYKEWEQSVTAAKTNPQALKKYFQPLATALILLESPAHLLEEVRVLNFPYECEGKFYALALWSMKGTSFTNAAKHIFTARKMGHLRTGYSARGWSLTTKVEKYGENFAHIPVIRPTEENTPAFLAFISDVIGANS